MFFPFPLRISDTSNAQIPFANSLLIAINVIAFWCGWSDYWSVGPDTGYLSVLTYGFAHASLWHLLGNMWALMVFGNPVNRRLGNGLYLAAYLGSMVALGLFARLLSGHYLLGSSGAIFSVIAICLLLMPAHRLEVGYIAVFALSLLFGLFHRPKHWLGWILRWDQFSIKVLWAIFLIPCLELWGLFWWGWNWTNLAHLVGLLCGMVVVLMLPSAVSMGRRSAYET